MLAPVSDDPPAPRAFGTADRDAPVPRRDFERALRQLQLGDLELRDALLQLGARVVALTDELTRRLDGVEPEPAAPGTAAPPGEGTVEQAVARAVPATLGQVRMADARAWRVHLDLGGDKYRTEPSTPPCDQLLALCQARCCTFDFALSTVDLDEGVIRWDYGQPYLIRKRASDGYCVHEDPVTRRCTVHDYRPRVCRSYDCRDDRRVWLDYQRRIPAPPAAATGDPAGLDDHLDLVERLRARARAIDAERSALSHSSADPDPRPGPPPPPRAAEPEPDPAATPADPRRPPR